MSSETSQEARDNPPAATSTDPRVVQGAFMGYENPGNHTDEGGVAELEEILKQRTFTRSEVDRLMSILRTRTVDDPGGNEEKGSEVKPVISHDKKEEFPKTPVRENGTENHLILTPVVSSTVLDKDVASPVELAKAYMGIRHSEVSTLSATSGEATEAKTQDTSFDNVAIVPFGSTSAFTSSGSNIFGGTSAVTGTVSSTSDCTTAVVRSPGNGFFNSTFSTVTNTGNGTFGGTSAAAGTSSSVFGGTSLLIASTGNSIFSTTSAITSPSSNIFGFSAPATSTSITQTQGFNAFNAVNTQASAAGTGIGTSTQSMPIQFSSSASSSSFGLAGDTTFSSGRSVLLASVAKPFGSVDTFGMSSSSSETHSLNSSSAIASGAFDSNWQAPKTPISGSSSSGFSFGLSVSFTAPSSAPTIFGSSTGSSSSSKFSFTLAGAATPSQPLLGNTSPGMVFGSTPSSNNDQMEDSMAEDRVQASLPTVPTFCQQPISPSASGFTFGASNPLGASSFQFGGQSSIATPPNPSPFQASGSLEFGAGGSFSSGTGGSDKFAKKYVKVRKLRKKQKSLIMVGNCFK